MALPLMPMLIALVILSLVMYGLMPGVLTTLPSLSADNKQQEMAHSVLMALAVLSVVVASNMFIPEAREVLSARL